MPLFDFLLIMVIIVTLYLGPMVLRRQGGIMAAVAHFPPDVLLN